MSYQYLVFMIEMTIQLGQTRRMAVPCFCKISPNFWIAKMASGRCESFWKVLVFLKAVKASLSSFGPSKARRGEVDDKNRSD